MPLVQKTKGLKILHHLKEPLVDLLEKVQEDLRREPGEPLDGLD